MQKTVSKTDQNFRMQWKFSTVVQRSEHFFYCYPHFLWKKIFYFVKYRPCLLLERLFFMSPSSFWGFF